MPYLRFKGFDEEFLQQVLPEIVAEFSHVAAVPRGIVKIELLSIRQVTPTPRSLEIFMFQRTQEKHDAIASAMHDILDGNGYGDTHIFFVLLTPSLYYKKGVPLKEVSWLA